MSRDMAKRVINTVLAVALSGCWMVSGGSPSAASVAHSDVVGTRAVAWTPQLVPSAGIPRPRANAVDQAEGRTWVGGLFGRVENAGRTQQLDRHNLAAFDATTGALSTIDTRFDGQVWAVEAAPDAVYVGGVFTTVDGQQRGGLAKLDPDTGRLDTSFRPPFVRGRVNEIELVDGRLWVGGAAGRKLMALDPDSGADLEFADITIGNPIPNAWGTVAVYDFSISPDGRHLVATGNFRTVEGQSRTRAFLLDLGVNSAQLSPWYYGDFAKPCSSTHPRRIAYLQGIDFSPSGEYFVVVATGQIPRSASELDEMVCDAAARFETSVMSPVKPTWVNYTGGDSVWSVAVTGAAAYVQGHFQWLDNREGFASRPGPGAVNRIGIGAIDPDTGAALPWAPRKPGAIGGKELLATPRGLWVVSDSLRFNGPAHRGVAFAALP